MKKIEEINNWQEMIGEVIHGDCLEVMRMIPDKAIDLVLTDPPYGLNKKLFNGGSANSNWAMVKYKNKEWDNVPSVEVFTEIFRISKNQIVFGGNYFTLPATRGIICWDKVQSAPNFSQWEMAWTSFDMPAKIFRKRFDFQKIHPTEKPLELFKWILQYYSEEGDLIFDGFAGSFTTARACKDMNRRWICCDMEEEYCEIGKERLRQELLF